MGGFGSVLGSIGTIAKKALNTDSNTTDTGNTGTSGPTVKSALGKLFGGKKSAPEGGGGDGGDPDPSDYHKGGRVKKTGLAKVHKGERVLTKKQAKKYSARKRV